MSRRSSIRFTTSSFDGPPNIPCLGYPHNRQPVRNKLVKCAAQMIKVLTAALVGTIAGIIVMVVVIALSGTDTSDASSVGLGSLPVSTFSAGSSAPSSSGGGSSVAPSSGGSSGGSSSSASGDPVNGKALFVSKTCSGCHADQAGAQSPFPAAPNLADLNASGNLTEARILTQIQNGGGPMPAGLASGQDAQDIAAYILTLGK